MYFKVLLSITFLLGVLQISKAQEDRSSELYQQLKAGDSLLFIEGFNRCNLDAIEQVLHRDLEFLHDESGVQNYPQFFSSFINSICSNPLQKPLRELNDASMEIYPLKKKDSLYGALQMGEHSFWIKEQGKEPYITGKAKFIHSWFLEAGDWKLKRVYSYDHKGVNEEASEGVKYDASAANKYGADEYGMKKYVMAILKKGPNRKLNKKAAEELQKAHLSNIGKLAEEGKLIIAGPFLGDQELRGIYIFDVDSIEEARKLTNIDPAIQAGSLKMELLEWYGSAALLALPNIHKTLEKKKVVEE